MATRLVPTTSPDDNKQKGTQSNDTKPNDAKDGDKPSGGDAKLLNRAERWRQQAKPKDDVTNPGANKPSETKPENDAKGAADHEARRHAEKINGFEGDKRVEKVRTSRDRRDGKDTGRDNSNTQEAATTKAARPGR